MFSVGPERGRTEEDLLLLVPARFTWRLQTHQHDVAAEELFAALDKEVAGKAEADVLLLAYSLRD